jgi:tRNA threonylcarbamoyladenosine biosynthesis protein TsaE
MRLSEADLVRWGRAIGREVAPPVVIALEGPLGAGKSVLARAIGEGAGVDSPMPSPTFNLLLRYDLPSGLSVVHLDLYRITEPDEIWELGWADLGAEREIVLIEWPNPTSVSHDPGEQRLMIGGAPLGEVA